MEYNERWDDMRGIMQAGGERTQSQIWTALPVKVMEDSDGFTVKLQPLIKGRVPDKETVGKAKDQDMPPLHDVPVQFSSGGGFTITHPIKKDDEGIAIFSARCIDNWHEKGDVQPQAWERWHDLSDAMYIPGIRSKARKLGGPDEANENDYRVRRVRTSPKGTPASTTSLQIRSDDGKYYIELGPEGVVTIICKQLHIKAEDHVQVDTKEVDVKASSKVHLETPTLEVTGDIKAGGDVFAHAGVSNVQMNWQPQYPASQGAPKALDPDAKGYWLVESNTPNLATLVANGMVLDGDFWIAQTEDPLVGEFPPVSEVPGLDSTVPIQNGSKVIWDYALAKFWVEPPVVIDDPDAPGSIYDEPWVGVLGVHVIESDPSDLVGGLSTAIGLPGDMFNIVGAINEKAPEISAIFNGAFTVAGLADSMNFNTMVTAIPNMVGKITGNPIMQAVVKLSTHGHHGVRSGPNISQKPMTGS